jgi:hypothetical protein
MHGGVKLGYWCAFVYAPPAHLLVGESNAPPFLTSVLLRRERLSWRS